MQDAACRMIWRRMAKASTTRESRQSYDEWLASGQPFGLDLQEAETGDDAEQEGPPLPKTLAPRDRKKRTDALGRLRGIWAGVGDVPEDDE